MYFSCYMSFKIKKEALMNTLKQNVVMDTGDINIIICFASILTRLLILKNLAKLKAATYRPTFQQTSDARSRYCWGRVGRGIQLTSHDPPPLPTHIPEKHLKRSFCVRPTNGRTKPPIEIRGRI